MRTMSNNQWNSPQGEGQWKPQGEWNPAAPQSAGERDQSQAQPPPGDSSAGQQGQDWNAGAQPQPPSGDWNTGAPRQDWNAGAQQQPSASDWNTGAPRQDWNTGAQPQPSSSDWNAPQGWGAQQQPSAADWNASQGWNPGATAHQSGWGDPHQQGGFAPGYEQQQWQQQRQPRTKSALGNVFDFSFKKFALPEAAGTIFLIAIIAIGVWWLVDVITVLTLAGGPYGVGPGTILQSLIGGVARSLLYVLAARVLLEGVSALITGSRGKQAAEPAKKIDDANAETETD